MSRPEPRLQPSRSPPAIIPPVPFPSRPCTDGQEAESLCHPCRARAVTVPCAGAAYPIGNSPDAHARQTPGHLGTLRPMIILPSTEGYDDHKVAILGFQHLPLPTFHLGEVTVWASS